VSADTNSVRFGPGAGNVVVDPAGSGAVVTSGGVLVAPTVGGNVQISGLTLTAGAANAANELIVHQYSTANTLTISSAVTNNGTGLTSVTKVGPGTLRMTGANTYTGITAVLGGVLEVDALGNAGMANPANPLGQSSNAAANLVLDGGTLRYVGTTDGSTDRLFTLGPGGATLDAAGTGKFTIGRDSGAASTGSGNRTLVLTGTGTGVYTSRQGNPTNGLTAVTKTGPGTWTISSASNDYGGPTTVLGGVLAVSAGIGPGGTTGSLGQSAAAAANLVIDGATLRWTGNRNDTGRLFTVGPNGATVENNGGFEFSFTNPGAIAYAGAGPASLTLGGTSTFLSGFVPAVGDAGPARPTSLTKTGTNTWYLIGANTYTGGTAVKSGTVVLSAGSGHLGTGPVTLGDAATNAPGTLQLGTTSTVMLGSGGTIGTTGAAAQTVGWLQSAGVGASKVVGGFTSVSTLTLDTPAAVSAVFAGTVGGTGTNNNNLALVKTGLGTQALTGANTYSGGTTIGGGALLVNGQTATQSGTGTGPVTVQAGGVLGGNGRVAPTGTNNTAVQSGGTITAGTAAGLSTLAVANGLDLQDGATYSVRLFGTGSADMSKIPVTGAVTIAPSAAVTLDLSGVSASSLRSAYPGGQTYTVLTGTTVTGSFSGIDLGWSNLGNFASSEWSLAAAPPAGSVQLVFTPAAVPEPASVFAVAAAALAARGLTRRRSRGRGRV
jgi:fibronectin-binding autotransporter adhesin